jgi:hypothetical protein
LSFHYWDRVVEEAEKRIAEEPDLLKKTFSPEFVEYAKQSNLFFSFGDIIHLIQKGLNYSITNRTNGGGAGIACFEDLIRRFRLYLIAELKYVIEDKEPFKHRNGVDYNFITDFLDQFKQLDRLDAELAEIRKKEGGNYG